MYEKFGRMHVRQNGEAFEEVRGSISDGGCERNVVHTMYEGCRAWGVLKSVLNNKG